MSFLSRMKSTLADKRKSNMLTKQTFGLSEKTTYKILTVFKTVNSVQSVILFGSRAKGNFKEGSDIDLAIKGQDLNMDTLRKLEIQIDNLMLPYEIDLIIYDQIKEPALKEHIDKVGIELV
jgi:predicted nucleotidyltransferase